MDIFLVTWTDYPGSWIIQGAFSTREKANNYIKAQKKSAFYDGLDIQEFIVDDNDPNVK